MGHWYLPTGAPYYSVVGQNGKERDVTLRDARQCGAAPSVTTVLEVLPKPALERWKVQQGILAALTMPRGEDSEEAWLAKVMADSKEQAKKAASKGAEIHDAIEKSFVGLYEYPEKYLEHVDSTRVEILRLFPDVHDWVTEKSFYHPLGFGGKADLHSPSTGIVIDFKTTDGDLTKKLAYDQNIQLAAYQVGLDLIGPYYHPFNGKFTQCANIFVSRTHPRAVASHVWDAQDVAEGWGIFEAALELWCRLNRYRPADWIQPVCAA